MSTKERVYHIIDKLSEEQLKGFIMLFKDFDISDDEDNPNSETQSVLNDVNENKNIVGSFSSVNDLMEDLGSPADSDEGRPLCGVCELKSSV